MKKEFIVHTPSKGFPGKWNQCSIKYIAFEFGSWVSAEFKL